MFLKCHVCTTHLHFLIFIHQEKTGNLLQKLCSLRFSLIGYLNSRWDRRLYRVDHCRFGWWRIRCELVFLLVASAVGAFLTVLAQVNFAVLTADHGSMTFVTVSVTSFTIITVRYMPRTYLNPLVVLQTLLIMELQLTTNTLQAFAFIALKRSLLRATAGITLLTY